MQLVRTKLRRLISKRVLQFSLPPRRSACTRQQDAAT